jgi:hypothetical protein
MRRDASQETWRCTEVQAAQARDRSLPSLSTQPRTPWNAMDAGRSCRADATDACDQRAASGGAMWQLQASESLNWREF